jgi:uncharacterized protein YhbP (UPF0306 family)
MSNSDPGLLRQQVLDYLAKHTVMTLATMGPDGPWAAAVFYCTRDFDLFFLSAGHTRHALNLSSDPQVAATIQENYHDWPEIQGIQLSGLVEVLAGKEREVAMALYKLKYPFVKTASPAIKEGLQRLGWYRLAPEKLYFIDNRKGFGHRDEIDLSN